MSRVRFFLETIQLIYKNMWVGRPKILLLGLILIALYGCFSVYARMATLVSPLMTALFTLWIGALWFIGVPCIFYLIDQKRDPQRIRKLSKKDR